MAVPEAVRKAAERANQIHADQYGGDENTPGAPVALADPPVQAGDAPGQPAQEPEHAEGAPTPAQEAPPQEQSEDWEHKYNVLKGKFNAETRRERERANEAEATVQTLQQAVAALTAKVDSMAPGQGQEPESGGSSASGVDDVVGVIREELGDEVADGLLKLIQGETSKLESKIDKVAKSSEEIAKDEHNRKRNAMFKILDSTMPTWEEVFRSPEFTSWKRETEPLSGETWDSLIARAERAYDADRILTIFQRFTAEYSKKTNAPNPPAQAPVAPDTGGGSAPQPVAENDGWVTRKEINDHYKKLATKTYGSDEERIAEHKRIDGAVAAGRVID